MTGVSVGLLGIVAVSFPLIGLLFAIVWSILYDYEASLRTECHVDNFLPTVSAAIGGFTPQRYVWRICITLHTGLRFMLAVSYYNWYMRLDMGTQAVLYHILVKITISCHLMEIIALVVLTCISSIDNGDIHEYAFIAFMVGSLFYMLLSCILIGWTHKQAAHKVQYEDKKLLQTKMGLFLFNLSIFLTSVYLYFRHNAYCEPYIYSWFALCEYLVIFSNIAFHGLCAVDLKNYSITFLATEDVRSGTFKNK